MAVPALGQTVPGEPLIGSGPAPLETLEDAWAAALAADRRLEASQWNLSAAERTGAAAAAERLPSVTLGADYLALSQEPSFKLPATGLLPGSLPFFQQDSGGLQAVVKQPLYTSGRITSGINAASDGIAASRAELCRSRLDVKMSVAEAYVLVLRARRSVEVADNKLTSLASHVRVVDELFDKGAVAKTDQLAARVAGADARQQVMQAQNGLQVAQAVYNRAVGRRLGEPVNLAELSVEQGVEDIDSLTHRALQLRPELAQISAQACALRDQAAGEQAKKGPQVAVVGGYVFQQNRYLDPDGLAGVAVMAEWNVIDSGRVCNRAASLSEKAEGLIRLRMDLESMVALDVRQKWLDLQTALARIDVARQATEQADENLQTARNRYRQQVGTNTEVLDAEALRVQAFTNYYNSVYEAVLARLRLARAVGEI
jgi:outer membrane protein TolC